MRHIDQIYTKWPFYGSRRLVHELTGRVSAELGDPEFSVNRKRVQRLLQLMGLEVIYPKKRPRPDGAEHRIFPYLLRGLAIERSNQVWSSDITYIRLRRGFVYLVAVMDWYSRYVVSWELSNTLEASFCVAALDRALRAGKPDIVNTDQGCQFTARDYVDLVLGHGIKLSMDGRGRAFDNIFIERLWRSVKYEEVYLKEYDTVPDAIGGLSQYLRFYNTERPHQALGYRTPKQVYLGGASWN